MVIRELTYQLHKLEASESALVSADHHDKKSVLGIGGKNPDRSIPNSDGDCLYGGKVSWICQKTGPAVIVGQDSHP